MFQRTLFSFLFALAATMVMAQAPDYYPGVLEVTLAEHDYANEVETGMSSVPVLSFKALSEKYGVTKFEPAYPGSPELQNYYRIEFTKHEETEQFINELRFVKDFVNIERVSIPYLDGAIPIDAGGVDMWYLQKINQKGWDHWQDLNGHGRIIKIAIVDDAVRLTHEDLRDVIYINIDDPIDGYDNDGNGYVDDNKGWDAADSNNNANPPSNRLDPTTFCHGTMVAGLSSASTDNGKGIASLGLNTRIIPVKCVSDDATDDHVLTGAWKGMEYAIASGAEVINCSWSQKSLTNGQRNILDRALAKGIIIVASAGNYNSTTEIFPAAYPGVIAVGATNNGDVCWDKSNYGSYIDVMAPGDGVYSTTAISDYSYEKGSGTSYAAPIVSGFIGLLLSQESNTEKVISILKNGCDEIDIENPGKVGQLGAGRINIDRSLDLLFNGNPDGLLDFNQVEGITVFPNPCNGIIHVPAEIQMQELRVVDLAGREVARVQPMSNSADLREFHLRGLYIVQIQTNEGLRTARVSFQ